MRRRKKQIPEVKWGDRSLNLTEPVFRKQVTEYNETW